MTGTTAPLSPKEFSRLRDLSGLTFVKLAKLSKVNCAKLIQFANGHGDLSERHISSAVRVMRKAIAARRKRMDLLLDPEQAVQP
jgi:hypothetical protein